MALFADVSLLVALGLVVIVVLSFVSGRFDRFLNRLSLLIFRQAVETAGRRRRERTKNLRAIHATTTYPVYASKTLLYSILLGIAGSLGAVYLLDATLRFVSGVEQAIRSVLPEALHFIVPGQLVLSQLSFAQIFVLLLVSSATFGSLGAGLTYYVRWWRVSNRAKQRRILIDESVARTIAFIYALSRSGMVYPDIMRTVGENRKAFGESAEEIGVVVKDMDLFGADLMTALERISQRSPSEQFSDFAENYASVLRSGSNVTEYLREQYDQYQSERLQNQEQLLETFGVLGEAYVAAFVAGPLFILTLLVIFGILLGVDSILLGLRGAVYFLIPVANVGFIWYLGTISEPLSSYQAPITQTFKRRGLTVRRADAPDAGARTDGGRRTDPNVAETNLRRLSMYNRIRRLRSTLLNPFQSAIQRPILLLYVTVPIATLLTVIRAWFLFQAGTLSIATVDDLVIQAGLVVIGSFAVVQELHSRRLRSINNAVPDFLDRLASTNEAGMTFTESLRRIERSDLGVLNDEVERLLSDINWGARTEKALYRFNDRINSSTIARVVALITNAMMASGDLGPVIRIASDEAREDRNLRKSRRQELFIYTMIIYIAFLVFLGISVSLQEVLIPNIPSAEQLGNFTEGGGGPGVPGAGGITGIINPAQGAKKDAFLLVLQHSAAVQAIMSGFVAGQMGEGSVADGAKHVTVMLGVAYVLFLVLG